MYSCTQVDRIFTHVHEFEKGFLIEVILLQINALTMFGDFSRFFEINSGRRLNLLFGNTVMLEASFSGFLNLSIFTMLSGS